MRVAMNDFRTGMEPQGESEGVYRIGMAIFGALFAVPFLIHVLASLWA
ncbi:MAG TPA: hypothetical protein VFB08_07805 [Burkholderiales bacterium]|nr:hypothetical protein [Burkholderiales bacterium]